MECKIHGAEEGQFLYKSLFLFEPFLPFYKNDESYMQET